MEEFQHVSLVVVMLPRLPLLIRTCTSVFVYWLFFVITALCDSTKSHHVHFYY